MPLNPKIFQPNARTITGLEVFRAGDYGEKGVYTRDTLARIASSYNAGKVLAAAINFDHKQEGPALGWISKVRAEGDRLFVDAERVHPDLFAAMEKGAVLNRSVEIKRSLEEAGGEPYLVGLAFLGAARPEVKGLETRLVFAAESAAGAIPAQPAGADAMPAIPLADIINPEQFSDSSRKEATMPEKDGKADGEKPTADKDQKGAKDERASAEKFSELEARLKAAEEKTQTFSALEARLKAEAKAEADKAKAEADKAKSEAEKFAEKNKDLEDRLNRMERERFDERRGGAFERFFEKAVAEGKLLPAHKPHYKAVAASLVTSAEHFCEPSGSTCGAKALDEILKSLPVLLEPGSALAKQNAQRFAEGEKTDVSKVDDEEREIKALMKERGLKTYGEAATAYYKNRKAA